MKIRLHFTKMSGAGNDFVVVENMNGELLCDKDALAVALCSRHTGIGADGLLVLERSPRADFFMSYYNADGSYGGMCGNGGRCVARYAYVSGIAGPEMTFEALDHLYAAQVVGNDVRLQMKDPSSFKNDIRLSDSSITIEGDFVDTGAPHFVIEQESLDNVDVLTLGRAVRFHSTFAPEGCNVDFVERLQDGVVAIRTYERGVEAETLACGTGCVAAAVVLARRYGLLSPVTLRVRSGEEVRVYFRYDGGHWSDVLLEGSAHFVFRGDLLYDTEARTIVDSPKILSHSIVT